jgi:hypothetical protein
MENSKLQYGVEYYPNSEEGEQWQELTKLEFNNLVKAHESRGYAPRIIYESFSVFENGRSGERLTLVDEWGIYYS